jgi:hypothetical protein
MKAAPSVTERLSESRERLRLALSEVNARPDGTNIPHGHAFPDWLISLKNLPGASLLLDVLQCWWIRQPFRVTLLLAAQGAKAVLQPMAQRHPYGLLIGAATLGGLLMLVRPWRWISASALWAGILPQLLSAAMQHMQSQTATTERSHDDAPAQSTS